MGKGAKTKRPGRASRPIVLNVPRFEQPDDETCGPTCLGQVYRYYGHEKPIGEIVGEIPRNPDGGTMAVHLGVNALRAGFAAEIHTYNLRIFDPTWRRLDRSGLIKKLGARMRAVRSETLRRAIAGYVEYLKLGGQVRFPELTPRLLAGILRRGHPIITGLSATYLYGTARERDDEYDDVGGEPAGHFVVISGYYPKSGRFLVRDPSSHSPFSRTGRYSVKAERLIAAVLLGQITYDAVLLVVKPGRGRRST
ncbi:MAG: peptidase-C39 like family protein [Gemmatimonadota bacterium]|nr:MAG: peptidase-C39 like family protein [Gemmatimonadota bacterium]